MPKAQSQTERAYDQVIEWLEHFEPLDDPRQSGKVWYPLDEVLLLCLLDRLMAERGYRIHAEHGSTMTCDTPMTS